MNFLFDVDLASIFHNCSFILKIVLNFRKQVFYLFGTVMQILYKPGHQAIEFMELLGVATESLVHFDVMLFYLYCLTLFFC
jgi:hypothetical protein